MKHFSILFAALLLAAGAASARSLPGEGALCAYLDSSYQYPVGCPDVKVNYLIYDHTFNPDGSLQKDCVLMLSDTLMPYRTFEYSYAADGRLNGYTYMSRWDGPWEGRLKYDLTFNAEGLLEDSINYAWSNDAWAPAYKYSHTYDAGRVSAISTYKYTEQDWALFLRQDYTYDADGRLLELSCYEPIGSSWYWLYTVENTYDDRGRLILYQRNTYHGTGNREDYIYHSDTTYTWLAYYRAYDEGEFQLQDKSDRTIDAAGRIVRNITYKMQSDGSWLFDKMYKYAFNDRGWQTDFERYRWKDGAWKGIDKRAVTAFDAFGHELEATISEEYDYDPDTQEFYVSFVEKFFYTYVYPSALDAVDADAPAQKFFRDGRILIRRADRTYDLTGRVIE